MMAPKRVDPAARREEILAAAVRVFARKGFAATRVEDVAAEAGIGKGSVYLSFDSRDALLDAAFEALTAASEHILREAQADTEPALDRLGSLVRAALAAASSEPDIARVLLDLWTVGRSGEGLPLDMARVYQEYRTVTTGLLQEAEADGSGRTGVGEVHAAVVVGAIEGCLLQWVIDPRVPIAEWGEPIVTVCLDGLRRREEP